MAEAACGLGGAGWNFSRNNILVFFSLSKKTRLGHTTSPPPYLSASKWKHAKSTKQQTLGDSGKNPPHALSPWWCCFLRRVLCKLIYLREKGKKRIPTNGKIRRVLSGFVFQQNLLFGHIALNLGVSFFKETSQVHFFTLGLYNYICFLQLPLPQGRSPYFYLC